MVRYGVDGFIFIQALEKVFRVIFPADSHYDDCGFPFPVWLSPRDERRCCLLWSNHSVPSSAPASAFRGGDSSHFAFPAWSYFWPSCPSVVLEIIILGTSMVMWSSCGPRPRRQSRRATALTPRLPATKSVFLKTMAPSAATQEAETVMPSSTINPIPVVDHRSNQASAGFLLSSPSTMYPIPGLS